MVISFNKTLSEEEYNEHIDYMQDITQLCAIIETEHILEIQCTSTDTAMCKYSRVDLSDSEHLSSKQKIATIKQYKLVNNTHRKTNKIRKSNG